MNPNANHLAALLGAALLAAGCASAPSAADMAPKPATQTTVSANQAMRPVVAAFDKRDLDDATRGKLAELSDPRVKAADGRIVWDTRAFDFLKAEAPATANPSLWRLQQLNQMQGLFKVADGIYQIRGYDIAGMTLVEGATGWIVIDTMLTAPVAKAGLKLAMDTLKSTKPVVAVIYTHSHADHFGGVRGVVDEADVRSGKVKIIAPDAFMKYAIAENVLAGIELGAEQHQGPRAEESRCHDHVDAAGLPGDAAAGQEAARAGAGGNGQGRG